MSEPLLRVRGLGRSFDGGAVQAVKDVDFDAAAGETIALVGPSGCGKSTLLNLLGMLERPSAGAIFYEGRDYRDIHPQHLFRARCLGFVFQFHHLVATMTLAENVAAPLVATGCPARSRKQMSLQALDEVGLADRAGFLPAHVSGGERQRAALARALVNQPRIILADEPTGNLDSANGQIIQALLIRQARQRQALVIIATHNSVLAAASQRQLFMLDGQIEAAAAHPVQDHHASHV
jgi:ABC-type lipoprotein export system ATPase subunit